MMLAEVTSTSPLQVRRDGDRIPVPAVETNVTVAVFDRVVVATVQRQVYIVAKVV